MADLQRTVASQSTPRAISWDFSRVPLFQPEQTPRPQSSFPPTATATTVHGAIQAKLLVGQTMIRSSRRQIALPTT